MKEKHDECVCALNETELALMKERDRLSELVDEWIDKVNKHLGTEIYTDGLYYESDWFPRTPTCKAEMD